MAIENNDASKALDNVDMAKVSLGFDAATSDGAFLNNMQRGALGTAH